MAAPTAGKIAARTRTTQFEIEGDDWEITYRPFGEKTLREAAEEEKSLSEDEQFAALRIMLSRVIVAWNLTDDEGNAIPFDADYLAAWGFDYVRQIQEAIVKDIAGPKASPTASSGRLALVATA